ncbi:MAG: hypothetical protein ACJ8AW_04190 [Rhodopila sp.]|jgi:hypothetical protein
MIVGRVVNIEASDAVQQVRLADGRGIDTRPTIIATGQSYALCKQLGMSRRMIREAHSLTFSFDIAPVSAAPSLIHFLSTNPRTFWIESITWRRSR